MIERLSLNSLKFFYYVARYDSVTIAAEKLFVTQGAVSKQLKNFRRGTGASFIYSWRQKVTADGRWPHTVWLLWAGFSSDWPVPHSDDKKKEEWEEDLNLILWTDYRHEMADSALGSI